jgi:hypothetical protein
MPQPAKHTMCRFQGQQSWARRKQRVFKEDFEMRLVRGPLGTEKTCREGFAPMFSGCNAMLRKANIAATEGRRKPRMKHGWNTDKGNKRRPVVVNVAALPRGCLD